MTDHDPELADLQERLQRAHTTTANASAPPEGLWEQIRLRSRLETKEEVPMSSTQMSALAIPANEIKGPPLSRSMRHFVNIVATIALVLGVALAGWFAAMQLHHSPSRDEPRLAVLATPEATAKEGLGTCDVQPLDTERVMEIVRNPARFMAYGPNGEPTELPMVGSPPDADLWEVDPDLQILPGSSVPDDVDFESASIVANQYLDCLLNGTQGQIWTFYSPVFLQHKILGEFPVFRSEEQVRNHVEFLATQPAYEAEAAWHLQLGELLDVSSAATNPEVALAIVEQSESSFYTHMLSIGVSLTDSDGEQVVLTKGTGRSVLPVDPMSSGQNEPNLIVKVVKLRSSETWLIIPWPSEAEMGW